jgi:hypothetical protein
MGLLALSACNATASAAPKTVPPAEWMHKACALEQMSAPPDINFASSDDAIRAAAAAIPGRIAETKRFAHDLSGLGYPDVPGGDQLMREWLATLNGYLARQASDPTPDLKTLNGLSGLALYHAYDAIDFTLNQAQAGGDHTAEANHADDALELYRKADPTCPAGD